MEEGVACAAVQHRGCTDGGSIIMPMCLDRQSLEIICSVVRRSLSYRFRSVSQDLIYDAVQEAACKFYEQESMRSEINSRTAYSWILTAATRELGHMLRHEGRFVLFSPGCEPFRNSPADSGEPGKEEDQMPGGSADQWSDVLTYNMLLGYLSQSLAEAVQLHFEGYTADEIAQHVGCTKAAAYKRVQRGCTELRELWQEEETRVQRLFA